MVLRKVRGGWRIYSRKTHLVKGKRKRRNLGTFKTKAQALQHEKEIFYFKHGK